MLLAYTVISQTKCTKFLERDGIAVPEFTINTFAGVFERLSIDARAAKKNSSMFGKIFSIAKNLDEYQYKICKQVPSMTDSPVKVMLQKHRIAIAAAFAKLVYAIREDQDALAAWAEHAYLLLVEVSDTHTAVTANTPYLQEKKIGELLAFFGLIETEVDNVLYSAYGQL
jgi:hypothetical protein